MMKYKVDYIMLLLSKCGLWGSKKKCFLDLGGVFIRTNQRKGRKLDTFYHKGTKCASCGAEAEYFEVQRDKTNKSYYLVAFTRTKNKKCLGKRTRMTVDHIRPRSKGGANGMSNRQVMCGICNRAKGNQIE